MSGAEIIINAIRGFISFAPIAEHSFLDKLIHEMKVTSVAALAFAPVWFLIFAVVFYRPRPSALSPACCGMASSRVLFLVGVLSAMVAVSLFAVWELRHAVDAGYGVDVTTPVIAVALEGFAEGSSRILQVISAGVIRFLLTLPRWLAPLQQTVAKHTGFLKTLPDPPDPPDPPSAAAGPPEPGKSTERPGREPDLRTPRSVRAPCGDN